MIREASSEKRRAIIIDTFNNFVLNYADVKKFDEIMQNRPMVEKGTPEIRQYMLVAHRQSLYGAHLLQ